MLYIHATRPCDRVGIIALWSFIAVLVLIYLVNLFGPPPPSVRAIATAGLSLWLFVVWAYWLDRHRQARSLPGTPPGA
jgi:polyferredoxin